MNTQKKIEKNVVKGYKAIETGVVNGYQKIEDSVVGSYKHIEKKFVDAFLTADTEAGEDVTSTKKIEHEGR